MICVCAEVIWVCEAVICVCAEVICACAEVRAHLNHIDGSDRLFEGMTEGKQVWMSHGDTIQSIGENAQVTCSTQDVKYAGFAFKEEPTWGIQFHPEVYHSEEGLMLLRNYVHGICGCAADWTPAHFVDSTVEELKAFL